MLITFVDFWETIYIGFELFSLNKDSNVSSGKVLSSPAITFLPAPLLPFNALLIVHLETPALSANSF